MKLLPTVLQQYLSRPLPDYVDAKVLGVAGTSETFTVPAGANYVVLSCNSDFYAKSGATAAVPGADVADGTASELNPVGYNVVPAGTLSVVSAVAGAVVTAAYYA